MVQINLEELTGAGKVHNLSGRERGLAARDRFKLDELDAVDGAIEVIVPEYVYGMSPSFVQGLFGASVRALGNEARFRQHFHFRAPDIVIKQLDRGLSAILTKRDIGLL